MSVVAKLDTRGLDKLLSGMDGQAERVIQSAAIAVQAQAIARAPVDTGALKGSIGSESKGRLTWWVMDGVDYGIWQELGTRKMPAHPFMVPAVESVRSRFDEMWKALFK